MTCVVSFVAQDAHSFLEFPCNVVAAKSSSREGDDVLWEIVQIGCEAEIVKVTPCQNGSVLEAGRTRKSRSSERDTEPRVKFQELKSHLTSS